MKAVSGRELIAILRRHGWVLQRINGSHHVLSKPGSKVRISVPVHANQTLKIGLLKHFLKQADLSEDNL